MAVDHSLAVARHMRRQEEAVHCDEQRLSVRDHTDAALDEALKSPVVRDRHKKLLESMIGSLLTFDVARRTIAELEDFQQDCLDIARRRPDLAHAISAMRDDTLDVVVSASAEQRGDIAAQNGGRVRGRRKPRGDSSDQVLSEIRACCRCRSNWMVWASGLFTSRQIVGRDSSGCDAHNTDSPTSFALPESMTDHWCRSRVNQFRILN